MPEFTPNIFAPIESEAVQVQKENGNEEAPIDKENSEKSQKRLNITAKIKEAADPSNTQ